MIENAHIQVADRIIKTRLHEHGLQPAFEFQPRKDWLESGYFDGKPEDMQALKDLSLPIVVIMDEFGNEEETLTGVVWGDVVETYPSHAIVHLDWSPNGKER